MSGWFQKGGVIYGRALAIIFLAVGVAGVLSAVSDVVSMVLDRIDTGSWHFSPFSAIPALQALKHPSFFQQIVIWLFDTPRFIVTALIGAGLLRIGALRWVDADLQRNPNG